MKNRKELLILFTGILFQIIFTAYYLIDSRGLIKSVHRKNGGMYYETELYQASGLIIFAVLSVILLEVIITLWGKYKRTYMATLAVTIGMLAYFGMMLQSFYEGGQFLQKHLIFTFVGVLAAVFTYWLVRQPFEDRIVTIFQYLFAAGLFVLIIYTFYLKGTNQEINGSYAWFVLGPISFQPGEFLKCGIVILAAMSYRHKKNRKIIASYVGINLACCIYMVIANDFGNLLILAATGLIGAWFLFFSEHKVIFTLISSVYVFLGSIGSYLISSNVRDRVGYCFQAFGDAGSHQYTSLMNIVKNGFFGATPSSDVSYITFVSASETDLSANTLFAIFGLGVFLLIAALFICLFINALNTPVISPHNYLLLILSVTMIFMQALLNMGGALNVIPFTGVCLPFISIGGSNTVLMYALLGCMIAGQSPQLTGSNWEWTAKKERKAPVKYRIRKFLRRYSL